MWWRSPPRMGSGVRGPSGPELLSSMEYCKAKDVTTLAKVDRTQRTSKWPIKGVPTISPTLSRTASYDTIRDTSQEESTSNPCVSLRRRSQSSVAPALMCTTTSLRLRNHPYHTNCNKRQGHLPTKHVCPPSAERTLSLRLSIWIEP